MNNEILLKRPFNIHRSSISLTHKEYTNLGKYKYIHIMSFTSLVYRIPINKNTLNMMSFRQTSDYVILIYTNLLNTKIDDTTVKVVRASANKSEGITIRTSQFNIPFENDGLYRLNLDGKKIIMKTSRNGKTLYTSKNKIPKNFKLPKVGEPVYTDFYGLRRIR